MSEAELDLSYEILDLIYERLGQEGLKDFIKDFKDYCDAIVGDSDSDYEPEESASDSESETMKLKKNILLKLIMKDFIS
jgi:hypothetical protein